MHPSPRKARPRAHHRPRRHPPPAAAGGGLGVFGNPGSNELPFLAGLPDDVRYVLGLHEGVVVGMADGYAQASGRLGWSTCTPPRAPGNAMGALTNAAVSRTPLLVLAGQQVRDTVGQEVMLASTDAALLTRPLTGFSAEPLSAADVPRTIAQALHQPRRADRTVLRLGALRRLGPPAPPTTPRCCSTARSAMPATSPRVRRRARRPARGRGSPLLVLGPDLDGRVPGRPGRAGRAPRRPRARRPVAAPAALPQPAPPLRRRPARGRAFGDPGLRGPRPRARPRRAGLPLPPVRARDLLPDGTALVQVTDDASAATRAPMGEAVVADPAAPVDGLLPASGSRPPPRRRTRALAALRGAADRRGRPAPGGGVRDAAGDPARRHGVRRRVHLDQRRLLGTDGPAPPGSYYFPASGGLGFGMPAAVGVALAQPGRRVVAVVGDGSANYGITALWSAAQLGLPVTFVILRNGSYGALRWFADLLGTPDVPGLDVPGIDFVPLAEGYGVPAVHVKDRAALDHELRRPPDGPRLIQVDTALTTPSRSSAVD